MVRIDTMSSDQFRRFVGKQLRFVRVIGRFGLVEQLPDPLNQSFVDLCHSSGSVLHSARNTCQGKGVEVANVTSIDSPFDEETEGDQTDDGRRLRRARNRAAVIDSLLELIRMGEADPTVSKIAERAGVSHRSVFRYFDDMDDLARTAIDQELRDALPLGVIPNVGEGAFDERIDALIDSRFRVFERAHPLWRVAHSKGPVIAEIRRSLEHINRMMRDQIARQFANEIAELPEGARHGVTHAIAVLMSFESYDLQHELLGLEPDEIRGTSTTAIARLLTA
jgi:AcrR family transcriptional regulator